MKGFDEFIEVFGNLTVAHVAVAIVAIVFIVKISKVIEAYFENKVKADMERTAEINQAIETTSHFSEYRQQSLDIQRQFTEEFTEIRKALEELTTRLINLEEDLTTRERNKLRDKLIQNHRYYTSQEINPMQAWTNMEAEAFWELVRDYEAVNGNGYVHSEIIPAMQKLLVIDLSDSERVSALMHSRK